MPYKDPVKQKQAVHESYLRNKEKVIENTYKRRERNIKFIAEYLREHPCVDCGESDIIVLEFDHIKGKDKQISVLCQGSSIERIKEEITKCEVVCCNCHRRRTAKSRFHFKNTLFV